MSFDLSRKYRVVCEATEYLDYADSLSMAKLLAGELQIAGLDEHTFLIVRQQGTPRRWKATLQPSGAVRLDELFNDGLPDSRADFKSRRRAAYVAHLDRIGRALRKRRSKKQRDADKLRKARSDKYCKGCRRGVVCLSTNPPRPFAQTVDAAEFAGVHYTTMLGAMRRAYRCNKLRFQYADKVLAEPGNFTAAQISAAAEAMRLSGRWTKEEVA
jgi:hypothetical protein